MGAFREGGWTERAVVVPNPLDRRRLFLQAGGVAFGAGVAGLVGAVWGVGVPAGAVVGTFATLGLMGRRQDELSRAAREEVAGLREEFGAGPVWAVDLLVRQGEAPTGRDQGLMWVEGGRIVFSGLRTSFALVPGQTTGAVRHESSVSGIRLRLNLPLGRETAVGGLSLSFWPLSEGVRRRENDAADLRFALNTVLDGHVRESPFAEGQWPPLALGPGVPSARALLRGALGRVLGWVAFSAIFGVALSGVSIPFGIGAFLLMALGSNWAFRHENRPRWAAWRARKVLEAG